MLALNHSALRACWVELYLPMLCLHRCPEPRRTTSTSSARARKRSDSRSSNVAPPHLLHWAGLHRPRISGMLALLIVLRQRYVVDFVSVASLARSWACVRYIWRMNGCDYAQVLRGCVLAAPCLFIPVSVQQSAVCASCITLDHACVVVCR